MSRNYWLIAVLLVVMAVFPDTLFSAAKVRFASQVKTQAYYVLPILTAMDKGFFKQQGIEVKYVPFRSGSAQHRGVAAGAVDMGLGGLTSLATAVARGGKGKAIADPGMVVDFILWVLKKSPLRKPQDLKGTKISITRRGSTTEALARAVTRSLGLEKDVRIVAAGGSAARVAALKSGIVDVTIGSFFSMIPLIVKGEVRQFLDVSDYVPRGITMQVLFAHPDFIKSNPAGIRGGVKAFMQGANFIMDNPEWALKTMVTHPDLRLSRKMADGISPKLRYARKAKEVASGDVRKLLSWLVDNGLMKAKEMPEVTDVSSAVIFR